MEVDTIKSITVDEFADLVQSNHSIQILDARKESEYTSEHIKTAEIPT